MDGTANLRTQDMIADRGGTVTPVAEIVRAFWRQKMLLVSVIVLVTALSAFAAYQIPPRYTATARILVSTESASSLQDNNVTNAARTLIGGATDRAAVYSEIEVMRSDRLLEKLIESLSLEKDAEFNPALQPGMFHR